MTLEEFRDLAETWGGDIERWPEERRAAAQDLAETAEASLILARARELDVILARRPAVSSDRAHRAAQAVTRRLAEVSVRQRPSWWDFGSARWLAPAAGLACSVLLGVSLALALPYDEPADQGMVLGMIMDATSLFSGLEIQ